MVVQMIANQDGLENELGRPTTGIKSLSAQFMVGMKGTQKTTISWVCWSLKI